MLRIKSLLANGALEGALCTMSLMHEQPQRRHDGAAVGASLVACGEGSHDPVRVIQALVWRGGGGVGGGVVGVGGA